jgi:hypothetical protein
MLLWEQASSFRNMKYSLPCFPIVASMKSLPGELELERLSERDRSHLLEACGDEAVASLIVNNAWLRDAQAKLLEPDVAVRVCEKAHQCGVAWNVPNFARAASVAVAVLHDEYRHDPRAALEELDRATSEFGANDGRVLIGKGKVLYGTKRFPEALDAFEHGLKDKTINSIDRVFAMRLLGISAANANKWDRAAAAFLDAAGVAVQHHAELRRMGIGLTADAAFAKWKQRDLAGAVGLLAQVLRELEAVPIDRDLRGRHLHATVRHLIVWVWARESERNPPADMVEPPPGMCSNQDPHEGMADLEIRDIETVWEILATTDERTGAGVGVRSLRAARAPRARPFILQAIERSAALDALRSGGDLDRAVQTLVRVSEAVAAQRTAAGERTLWESGEIAALPPEHWNDEAQRGWLARMLVAVGVVAVATGKDRFPTEAWERDLRSAGALRDEVARVVLLLVPSARNLAQGGKDSRLQTPGSRKNLGRGRPDLGPGAWGLEPRHPSLVPAPPG